MNPLTAAICLIRVAFAVHQHCIDHCPCAKCQDERHEAYINLQIVYGFPELKRRCRTCHARISWWRSLTTGQCANDTYRMEQGGRTTAPRRRLPMPKRQKPAAQNTTKPAPNGHALGDGAGTGEPPCDMDTSRGICGRPAEVRHCHGDEHGYCCVEGTYLPQPDGVAVHRMDLSRAERRSLAWRVRARYANAETQTFDHEAHALAMNELDRLKAERPGSPFDDDPAASPAGSSTTGEGPRKLPVAHCGVKATHRFHIHPVAGVSSYCPGRVDRDEWVASHAD